MALNRSVGAAGVARKANNIPTKPTGIPSAPKVQRSADQSIESTQKVTVSQLADSKATSGTSPKPRSGARDKGSIAGRTVPSLGGTAGVNNNAKMSVKSTTSLPQSTHGIGGGRLPKKVVAKDQSGRSSPKSNGLPDVSGVVTTEPHSKPDAMPHSTHVSSLQSTSSTSLRVDRNATKPNGPAAHTVPMEVGLPAPSSNKRLSVGSLGAKPSTTSVAMKGRSPPLSSTVNSEAKTESPKVRKTTGIAKLQNHPSSATRSVTGTTARPRGPSGPASVCNAKASVGVRSTGGSDLNANTNTGGKDAGIVRKDVRTRTLQPTEKVDNAVGADRRSSLLNHKNLGIASDQRKLPVARNLCKNMTENQRPKIPVNASQDFINKACEETVEDVVSECEYFSETRSTVSENLSDFADGGLNPNLTDSLSSLGRVNLSELRHRAEGNITSQGTSLDDIFASCEDFIGLGEDTIDDGSSRTSGHTASPISEQSCQQELVEESFPVQSVGAFPSHSDLAINDHDLQVMEDDSTQHDLQIVEDGDYGDDARMHGVDSSVVCEHSLAADIPETSFDGRTVGSNLTVRGEIDAEQFRANAGSVFQDDSEATLNNSSSPSSLKDSNINMALPQYASFGNVDEEISQAEDKGENQSMQGLEKTVSESLSKCSERQNDGDEDLRNVATLMPDLDQELRIIEEETLPSDFDLRVDDAAVVDAELGIEGMTVSADAEKPEMEDASEVTTDDAFVSEVTTDDAFVSKVATEEASVPCANQKMRVEDAPVSANGHELMNDDSTVIESEGKCRGCSSNGFGADGVTDSDGDGSSGPHRAGTVSGTASTPTEASAAAAESLQLKVCSATHKGDNDSIGGFLGDSCETLTCEDESDVESDLTKDMDGGSAAGSAGSCCGRNQICACSIVSTSSGCTDVIGKNSIHISNEVASKQNSGAFSGDSNESNVPTQIKISDKSRCFGERVVNSPSSAAFVKVVRKDCISDRAVIDEELLSGKGSGQSEDEHPTDCQEVGGSGGGSLSFSVDLPLQKTNCCDQDDCVASDTNCVLKGKDNNTCDQDGTDCRGTNVCLPGAPSQLSSSFINEFSAWLGTEAVTGCQTSSFDPGVSQLKRNAEADSSSASQLKGSSVVAMDTQDVKVNLSDGRDGLTFVDEEEFDDDAQSEEEKTSIRENLDSNYKAQKGSFFNNSIHQQETVGADSVPQTFNTDITSNSTGPPGGHCSAKGAMPQRSLPANVEGSDVDQRATEFVQMAGSATDSSLTQTNGDNVNKSKSEILVQNQKTDERLAEVNVCQNPQSVFSVANQATLNDKVVTWMQNEGDSLGRPDELGGQEVSSAARGANKLREPTLRPSSSRASLPASLTHGNMMSKLGKGLDSSIHRGPSPLSVLTDRPVDENSKDVGSSQNLSDIPLLSIRRFRPIAVQDYFTVSSSNSLNSVGHETSEKITTNKQVDASRLTKDANHNVVMASAVVGDRDIRPPTSEIAGFLSPRYVPSRPLSQICSRTMGNSLRRNIGCDTDDTSSLTSVESLPAVDSSGNASARPNILAQIRFARSCSRIGLKSPMPSEGGFPEHAYSSPRLPVAGSLPSFDLHHCSSGGTLTPQTPFSAYSRTDSSRQSQCSTPVVGDCPSTCSTPTMNSAFVDPGSLASLRKATARLSRHQALDDELHGSFVSLASVSSSVFSSSAEEKQTIELRKLKHELEAAKETVGSLKTQLNVHALMSKTYEQNIEGLTQRLKQLVTIIDQKESELCELRSALRNNTSSNDGGGGGSSGGGSSGGGLQTIPDCVSVGSSFHRRSSNSSSLPHDARSAGLKYLPVLTRHISCESVNSLNSQSSSCSMGSQQSASLFSEKKKKKKNWIRSSFSKAFSRKKTKPDSVGEPDSLSLQSDTSNNEPIVIDSQTNTPVKNSSPEGSHTFPDSNEGDVEKRLHEADMELTELRLEQLASIQNIDHLQEKINLLEQQVATLKAENKSLQRLLLHQGTSPSTPATSLAIQKRVPDLIRQGSLRSSSPGTPLPSSYSVDGLSRLTIPTPREMSSPKLLQRFSLVDAMASDASYEQLRQICVYVLEYGCELHGKKGTGDSEEETNDKASRQIGVLMLSEQASWLELDLQIGNLFVEHVHNLDPETGLGLDERSIASYRLGCQERIPNSKSSDSLPSKNLPTSNACIKIRLRDWQEDSVDFLAFDTLVPKPFLCQYVSLLLENRRLLFCGPNLSGKTFLAKKLARHLVLRKDKKLSSISIAQFTVDSKSSKELQQYLSNIVSHCEQASDRLPSVIVIDNLHLADNLSKAFSGFFSLDSQQCPYLIGTMTQSRAASITCLQFHQNFRWVLFNQTDEPMKSFLARYLHRQSAEKQFRCSGGEDDDCGLLRVVDWMPKVWHHVNRFVASICSPDKCIGPGIFLPCPMDVDKARAWFVDLWNYSIGPYLLQLIKDSSTQVGFSRSACEDPTDWVLETSAWDNSKGKGSETSCLPLLRLFPYQDSSLIQEQSRVSTPGAKPFSPNLSGRSDPLLDMLLHLQVATCYADSVCTTSNNTPSRGFSGLSTASKISAAPSSLHSAAL